MINGKSKLMLMILVVLGSVMLLAMTAISATSAERGKALFNDPNFAGGKKACSSTACHLEGRNLVGVTSKSKFNVMGNKLATIEDVVNFCIKNANQGKPIKKNSKQMKDMIEYLKSLSPKSIGIRG